MESKGRFILLGLLLVLVLLCHSGHGLTCFACTRPLYACTVNQTCESNYDTCVHIDAGPNQYFQCWKVAECKYEILSKQFAEKTIKYRCCQEDLCNKDPKTENNKAAGKTTLLMTLLAAPLLATAWNLHL